MKEYIFGERNGIHIIDLQKTLKMFREAARFVSDMSSQGKAILFVGTKRQAQEAVCRRSESLRNVLRQSPLAWRHADELDDAPEIHQAPEIAAAMVEDGRMAQLSKKEAARLKREMDHLNQNLGGMENMTTLPDAMFVIDSNAEEIAVREARRMGIPVVSIVDTNCDPEVVDWVIPGNDDALRAIRLFTSKISDAVIEGKQSFEQSQLVEAKSTEGGEPTGIDESVDYVDTSKYESYEKQEGEFIDPATLEQAFAAAPNRQQISLEKKGTKKQTRLVQTNSRASRLN